MNRKPIRRNENILKLSKEHHFSLLFCWKIRQGLKMNIDASRIVKYAQYFHAHFLRLHFREEELLDNDFKSMNTNHSRLPSLKDVYNWYLVQPCNLIRYS